MEFSPEELSRYSRHLNLPNFSLAEQSALRAAKVLVVGAGGLGSPMLQYLVAAGVGTIGIIDPDTIEVSNLQRQILFRTEDIGQPKAVTAARVLSQLNPHITVRQYSEALTASNAMEIVQSYDIVADGTDNFPTRYLVNDACVLLDKVNVHASIFRFEGQVSVFNYLDEKGARGPNYRDLFPTPPPADQVMSCEEGGILGVLAGIVGSMQALEVIKVILRMGEVLSGKLWTTNTLTHATQVLNIQKNPQNPISGDHPTIRELIDYDAFCGINLPQQVTSISADTLKQWLEDPEKDFQLVDVREAEEYERHNIGGLLLPLSELGTHIDQLNRESTIVVHCQSGIRSRKAIKILSEQFGFTNLINLEGGLRSFVSHK